MAKKKAHHEEWLDKPRAAELARVQRVFRKHARRLRRRKGVVHVGFGLKRTCGRYHFQDDRPHDDQLAIIVYVEEKLDKSELDPRALFPRTIEGIPVDVQTLYGKLTAGLTPPNKPNDPLVGGIQVSSLTDPTEKWGSMGLVVKSTVDKGNRFLTAAHVAFLDGKQPGDPFYQPPSPGQKIGKLEVNGLEIGIRWDAATILPATTRGMSLGKIPMLGTVCRDPLEFADLSMFFPVQSVGTQSWLLGRAPMKGKIAVEPNASLPVKFPPLKFALRRIVAIAGNAGHFSESGDSGAPVVHVQAGKLSFLGMVLGVQSDSQGNEDPAPGRFTFVQVLGVNGFDALDISLE